MRLEEKLVCLRKERHMTQLELAEALDVSRQAISKWELGTAVPSTENLIRLAQLYGVPVDHLVNDTFDLSDPAAPLSVPPLQSVAPSDPKKHFVLPWVKWVATVVCVFMLGLWIGAYFFSSVQPEDGASSVKQIDSLDSKRPPLLPDVSFSLSP